MRVKPLTQHLGKAVSQQVTLATPTARTAKARPSTVHLHDSDSFGTASCLDILCVSGCNGCASSGNTRPLVYGTMGGGGNEGLCNRHV